MSTDGMNHHITFSLPCAWQGSVVLTRTEDEHGEYLNIAFKGLAIEPDAAAAKRVRMDEIGHWSEGPDRYVIAHTTGIMEGATTYQLDTIPPERWPVGPEPNHCAWRKLIKPKEVGKLRNGQGYVIVRAADVKPGSLTYGLDVHDVQSHDSNGSAECDGLKYAHGRLVRQDRFSTRAARPKYDIDEFKMPPNMYECPYDDDLYDDEKGYQREAKSFEDLDRELDEFMRM